MNKKAQIEKILDIAAVLFAFAIIGLIVSQFVKTAAQHADESVCRDSVFMRERLHPSSKLVKLAEAVSGTTAATPLLCSTKHSVLSGKPDEITKQIADMIAKCWWQFGQGVVPDPLKEGTAGGANECMMCYTFTIDNPNYKISGVEMLKYLADHNYTTTKIQNKKAGVSYLQYVQSYGEGEGNLVILPVEAPLSYAITYGAPTESCGEICSVTKRLGTFGGAATGATIGIVVFCLVPGVGWGTCAVASASSILQTTLISTAVGYAAGVVAGVDIAEWISKREVQTVYLTPYEIANQKCVVHEAT